MPQGDLVLYLTLAPEFGGTRFGPFEGVEARLGSDKDRCHITIPESLGVAKEHCRINRQGPANLILTPSERTASVYLWKGDARRPIQVQTATAVRPGDSFSLVSPEGPRFIIELGELPPEEKEKRSPSAMNRARGKLTAGKLAEEGKRLGLARIFTIGPVQILARAYYFVTSGAIFQPRYIILGAVMAFGYLTGGLGGCAALKFRSDRSLAQADALNLQEQLAACKGASGDVATQDVKKLATALTVPSIGTAMDKDSQFAGLVRTEAKKILENPGTYDWLYEEKSQRIEDFSDWREKVGKAKGLDPDTQVFLPFLAAVKNRNLREWDVVLDSTDTQVCGRGPIRLTYRQAKNLGLEAVQLDAYAPGDATLLSQDDAERGKLLAQTASAAGEPAVETPPASGIDTITAGDSSCVRAEGDDDRATAYKVIAMLNTQLGREAKGLPDTNESFGVVARIAKIFAADIKGATFVPSAKGLISFAGTSSPSSKLSDVPGGEWVMKRTAEIVARALVLPCRAALDYDPSRMQARFGKMPNDVQCLVLNYRLTHE